MTDKIIEYLFLKIRTYNDWHAFVKERGKTLIPRPIPQRALLILALL